MFKCIRNIATGAVIGAAVSAMIVPQLDRKHQKNIKRLSKKAYHLAEDTYDNIMDYIK